mgnify:CR=1 FL=1
MFFASTTPTDALGGHVGPLHDLPDQAALVRSVCAFSETVLDPAEIPGLIARAWEVYAPQADAYVTRALNPTAAPSYGVPGDE